MLIRFEDISYNNMPLSNAGLYENSASVCVYICVCTCAHVCATVLWLHVLLPSTLGLGYLVQYFNRLLAKQWNKFIRVILLFAMEPIVQGRQKHDIQYQDIFIYYVYLFLRENKPALYSKSRWIWNEKKLEIPTVP